MLILSGQLRRERALDLADVMNRVRKGSRDAVLLMPLLRFLPPDDERVRNTIFAIADELTVDGFVLRYRTDETDDGMSGPEGSFMICSWPPAEAA